MATPKEPTRHERLGAAVVATVLQSNARFIDNGLSKCANQIVDYELDLPDGERAGLEISRITDGGLLNMSASAAKLDWRTKTRYLWYLGVANRPRLADSATSASAEPTPEPTSSCSSTTSTSASSMPRPQTSYAT
jgi:hypothetical protein